MVCSVATYKANKQCRRASDDDQARVMTTVMANKATKYVGSQSRRPKRTPTMPIAPKSFGRLNWSFSLTAALTCGGFQLAKS